MSKELLHTPDGVRDIYNLECAKKDAVERRISEVMKRYGYRNIQTPTFEFFDIFKKERGSVISKEMFKFFDRDGETLVLRPDITPSIARSAAKYFMDEDMPIRLSYCGNIFINKSSYQGRLKESTQMGAELIGDVTGDADAEMAAMLISCLLQAGLNDFQVEIGHINFFNGLMEAAHLDEDDKDYLRTLIENKNYFGVENFISEKEMAADLKHAILEMPKMFGTIEQIRQAKALVQNIPVSLSAIEALEELYDVLKLYGVENYITFDLGMLGKFKYYTGIIFKAYTYGTGDAIATGGRYDKLLMQFGKQAASIGFGIGLDALMIALERQKIEVDTDIVGTILLYDRRQKAAAIRLAAQLRSKGTNLQLMKKYYEKSVNDYMEYAKRSYIGKILYIDEIGELVQVITVNGGEVQTIALEELLKA